MSAHARPQTTVFALVSQPILAEGLARILESNQELRLTGASCHVRDALDRVVSEQPQILIADHELGMRTLSDLIGQLRTESPGTQIVVWTKDIEQGDRHRLIEYGIRGLLDKAEPVEGMLDCLRSVAGGSAWTNSSEPTAAGRAALRLTARERQVLACLREGMKNREIAKQLAITAGTVKVHLMHIFEKTGLRDRNELGMHADQLLAHTSNAAVESRA